MLMKSAIYVSGYMHGYKSVQYTVKCINQEKIKACFCWCFGEDCNTGIFVRRKQEPDVI